MIKKEYYCDRCGDFIVNEENRTHYDMYAAGSIYIGDPVGKIHYNILVKPFDDKNHPYFQRRLEETNIFCKKCSTIIAIFLGLLKDGEYDEKIVNREIRRLQKLYE